MTSDVGIEITEEMVEVARAALEATMVTRLGRIEVGKSGVSDPVPDHREGEG